MPRRSIPKKGIELAVDDLEQVALPEKEKASSRERVCEPSASEASASERSASEPSASAAEYHGGKHVFAVSRERAKRKQQEE